MRAIPLSHYTLAIATAPSDSAKLLNCTVTPQTQT